MIKRPIGIIIPTYNNFNQLLQCVNSIIKNKTAENLFHIYIVNNGHRNSCDMLKGYDDVTVVETGDNLGWVGGLKVGMEASNEPFLVFSNDDIVVPMSSMRWLRTMLDHFIDDRLAAVGPSSNVVMGKQNIWSITELYRFYQRYLIFFCVMVRREAIEKAGGLDDSMHGGDDFDLCIRFWKNDYKTLVDKRVFIYHHGFQTGKRVYGDHTVAGGWNSYEYKHRVDTELIRKHGLRAFYETMTDKIAEQHNTFWQGAREDEADLIRKLIKKGIIYEFGVGNEKTVPEAIGVDIIEHSEFIDTIVGTSIADITHDLNKPITLDKKADTIIARQILEHLVNPIEAVENWGEQLKKGGRLIITVPDNELLNFVPINIEHLHAFDKNFLETLINKSGLKVVEVGDVGNGISIYGVGEKQ